MGMMGEYGSERERNVKSVFPSLQSRQPTDAGVKKGLLLPGFFIFAGSSKS